MPVGAGVAVVRAVDVAAWNVMVLVNGTIGKNAFTGEFPLAEQEGFGRVGRIDGPDVAGVVGVGSVFRSDHGQVAPVDAEDRVFRTGAALVVPRVDGVGFCSAVAQEMVIRNRIVNPAVAVESPRAAAPFFWRHVGVAAPVGAVPAVGFAWTAKPSPNFVVLRP